MESLLESPASKTEKIELRKKLYERQGKSYYRTDKPDVLIQEFFSQDHQNDKKRPRNSEMESLRNTISSYLFEYLEEYRIATHYIRKISDTEMMVKPTDAIPVQVRVFNVDDGSIAERFQGAKGSNFEFPIIEHYYSSGGLSPWMNEYHVYALGVATPEEFKQMNRIASKANAVIRGLCERRQLGLAKAGFAFGRLKGQVVLIDELSPQTCTFLDHTAAPVPPDSGTAVSKLCDRLMMKV
ncbi:MAG TPA: phosphoribosylaminoimidazolesuccinocarboxamide synthase [Bacteroidota bacterium]|nr:phosphoribosylaminoimidazolesuccinocarboxamide synthase [Bacteroidota bacterium]